MNRLSLLLLLGFLLLIYSCQKKNPSKIENLLNNDSLTECELLTTGYDPEDAWGFKWDIGEKGGDTLAYSALSELYRDLDCMEDILSFALIMAHKYNYASANLDVYYALQALNKYIIGTDEDHYSLDGLDTQTRTVALDYLQRSYKLGVKGSVPILYYYYKEGRYLDKDTELAGKLYEEWKHK